MTEQFITSAARTTRDRVLKVLTPVIIILGFAITALIVYGSIGGGTYVHAGSATNAALFSGKAVVHSEKTAADRIAACGKSTHTIRTLTYSTAPFLVDGVVVNRAAPASAFAGPLTYGPGLSHCLMNAFAADGASAQLCTIQAAHSAGLKPADVGPRVEATVICATEVGKS